VRRVTRAVDTVRELGQSERGIAMGERTREELLVHWQGRQWAVTSFGIESTTAPATVRIPKWRLGSAAHDMNGYSVVPEILAHRWLDVSDFWEAWEQACIWHHDSFAGIPLVWRNALARRTEEAIHKRLADAAIANMAMIASQSSSKVRRKADQGKLRRAHR